jgi:translation elongation factor EF-G
VYIISYFEFISDEHFFKCIEDLYNTYESCKKEYSLKDFYKNKVDPIKFYFDTKFNDIKFEDYINHEINRKNDKTINNAIGLFHQKIFDGIDGFEAPDLSGYDVKSNDNTIFAEVKNKHNTMNSSSAKSTFLKLKNYAEEYENSTCYLVEVISKKSQEKVWKLKHYEPHPRVKKISIDRFYELVTGDPLAFKKLCEAIPEAVEEFLKSKKLYNEEIKHTVYEQIKESSEKNKRNILEQIMYDNFSTSL